MKRGTESDDYLLPAASLWVVVSGYAHTQSFELDGERRRAIAIGSCVDADVCLDDRGVAPVECFIVRDGDQVRLVPACAASDVRVGALRIDQPMRLWRRTQVRIGGVPLELRIREEPPTAPDHEAPSQTDLTHSAAGTAYGESPSDTPSRVRLCEVQADVVTVRPLVGFDGVIAARTGFQRSAEDFDGRPPPRYGLHDEISSRAQLELLDSPPPSSTAPSMVSVMPLVASPSAGLERLGVLAQRRPGLVALGSSVGAALIALGLHWGATVLESKSSAVSSDLRVNAAPLVKIGTLCGPANASRFVNSSARRIVCEGAHPVEPPPKPEWISKALRSAAGASVVGGGGAPTVVPVVEAPLERVED